MKLNPKKFLPILLSTAVLALAAPAPDHPTERAQVAALGESTTVPTVFPAEGFAAEGTLRPVFFEGLPYQGRPTRVFAWVGMPAKREGKVPGVVLVHGGGGTAFKEWVKKWNDLGFAAISIAVEGQTDRRVSIGTRTESNPQGWEQHAWAGPARTGIYGDADAPLKDQWMYHAVADTILANSLLRSMPEVDATRVGVCGISWGGVITSTVVGIDARFAFGIPIYGCGDLARAPNRYGTALHGQSSYLEVWNPMLHLARAKMPLLWFTGPRDVHFPLEMQQTSYRAASGPRLVSVPFDMKHGHGEGWNPPDSYAFAKAVVETGRPWAREVSHELKAGAASVTFETMRLMSSAVLVFKRGADWEQAPARLATSGNQVRASATIPGGSKEYYFNLLADGLTLSSEWQTIGPKEGAPAGLTGFNWDRVPLNLHFGKRKGDLTDAEIDFIASHGQLIALEKGHGAEVHGSTEAGIADTARRLKQRNPDVKVLFYLNAFINWTGYESFKTYRPEWTLRDVEGKEVMKTATVSRPDPSNAEFREWWSDVVAAEMKRGPIDGLFADALPQALTPAFAQEVGPEKAQAVVAGLREMLALTKRKIGPDRIVLVNGTRSTNYREILDWEGIDGVMIEHFDAINTTEPADIKADLDTIALAAAKGKFVVIKAWPGFTFIDREAMSRPHDEKLQLARERITFPLACYLAAVQPGSYFCYSWGYVSDSGMLDSYPELDRPLGPPLADAIWDGLTATREFAHAKVWVDITTKQARIDWH